MKATSRKWPNDVRVESKTLLLVALSLGLGLSRL